MQLAPPEVSGAPTIVSDVPFKIAEKLAPLITLPTVNAVPDRKSVGVLSVAKVKLTGVDVDKEPAGEIEVTVPLQDVALKDGGPASKALPAAAHNRTISPTTNITPVFRMFCSFCDCLIMV
jgi:hypothetical protein